MSEASAADPAPAVPAGPPPPRPRPRGRGLAHSLVDDFSVRIRDAVLRPGDKLPTESAIMQAYGVSRTVVREALSKLQAAGLVETHHGVGTFVLQPRAAGIRAAALALACLVFAAPLLVAVKLRLPETLREPQPLPGLGGLLGAGGAELL